MKKIISALIVFVVSFSLLSQPQVQAAAAIKVYIDGVELRMDQPPVMSGSRTLVPLRGIFEALNASVSYNDRTRTITSQKDGTTVVLQLGAKTATINNTVVALDTPATPMNGRTMVPLRFVSEALGQNVEWQPSTYSVLITTSGNSGGGSPSPSPSPGSGVNELYVSAIVNGQNGNGSDVLVNFSRLSNIGLVSEYRVFVVKEESASSFNITKAQNVSYSNYSVVPVTAGNQGVYLSAQARDVDGNLISQGYSYKAFVLTVMGNGDYALSVPSAAFSLIGNSNSVLPVSNVALTSVGNYGDGRDLAVSFTKAQNESNISEYRIFIVKTKDAANFNLAAANAASSQNYTYLSKAGNTLSTVLSSSSRDTSGEFIKNGVAYTGFVLSVSNNYNTFSNKLSSASSSLSLGTVSSLAPVISWANAVNNYGDGRDIQLSFTRSSDESNVSSYRVFVVRESNSSSFDLNAANNSASGRYYDVSKSGSGSITTTLPSSMKDIQGLGITTGVNYRVYVMAVSNYSVYSNVLSAPSTLLTLSNGYPSMISNLTVSDTNDYGDGRDLQVSFTGASNESDISQYRVFVVKTSNTNNFDVNVASNLPSSYYTNVSPNGRNQNFNLSQSALTTDGSKIVNGVSYRVFVMSVSKSGNYGSNVLSTASAAITLTDNSSIGTVSNLNVSNIANNGNASDWMVSFSRAANESYIDSYRIMVVKDSEASSFNLAKANNVTSSYYKQVSKTGSNFNVTLDSWLRTVNGDLITNGITYRVFVLSVGTSGNSGSNALSTSSAVITLANNYTVGAVSNLTVSNIAYNGNASDWMVSFARVTNESYIDSYRIMVVKDSEASSFNLAKANNVTSSYYKQVSKTGGNLNVTLDSWLRTVNGELITNGITYRVFVLSVGTSGNSGTNVLSESSRPITLNGNLTMSPVKSVFAFLQANNTSITVSFTKSESENLISEYRIFAVPSDRGSFTLSVANAVNGRGYISTGKEDGMITRVISTDINGNSLQGGVNYTIYVLAVSNGAVNTTNALSAPSNAVFIPYWS